MNANDSKLTRRHAVVLGTRWLFAGSAGSVVAIDTMAGKASKADFYYQEKPKDGKSCANCKLFIASTESGKGSCALVDGEVSPVGWCMAYSPRSQ